MISWRYHLVSIVAVFLALALGVLAGTTVLDQGIVNDLKDRTERLQEDLAELRSNVGALQDELGTMNAFADEALPYLVGSRLFGYRVVIVTQDGVEDGTIERARETLDLAGAEVLTTLSIRPEMAADTPEARSDLAALLGMAGTTSPEDLTAAAAALLADRLAEAPAGDAGDADPLGEMLSQGFVTASAPGLSDATLREIGGPDQLVVAVGGGEEGMLPEPSSFLLPLVRELAGAEVVAAAGESLTAEVSFVGEVREAIDADAVPLVTVDDLDLVVGGAALVLGLERAELDGTGGHYGVKPGASRLLPAPG